MSDSYSSFSNRRRESPPPARAGAAAARHLPPPPGRPPGRPPAQMDLEATSAEFRRTSPQARPGGQSQIKEIVDMKNEELKEFEEYLNENNCLEDQQVIFDPIVMSVYKEPVIASDGNTYDIDTYNKLPVPKKSPITREELTGIIYPNLAAKQFILCQLEKYNKEKKSTKGGRRRTKHKKSKRKTKRKLKKNTKRKLKKNTKRKPKRRARKTRKH